jgi:dTDP-4-amino-4,6-dideoxygalactose transaminase
LLARSITPNTSAILVVHQMGMPCDLAAVLAVAERHGLPVVEDAACAIGSQVRVGAAWERGSQARVGAAWERVGRPHGTVACFSFHPRKVITTGDGGMLTTNDAWLQSLFRLLRQHGMSVPDTVRHASAQVVFEDYPLVGFNYRMTDIQAAIGRVQLRRLPEILRRRAELAENYTRALGRIPGLLPPFVPAYARPNYQAYPVRVTPEYPLSRDDLMRALLAAKISTRRGIMNAHQEPAYADLRPQRLPCSEEARDRVLLLPLYHGMTDEEQDYVIDHLRAPAAGKRAG